MIDSPIATDDVDRDEILELMHALEFMHIDDDSEIPNLQKMTSYGWNVLHFIAKNNKYVIFDSITSEVAPLLSSVTASGETALDIAAANGATEMLTRLVSLHVELSVPLNVLSALNYALEHDHESCVKALVATQPEVMDAIDSETTRNIFHKIACVNAIRSFTLLKEMFPEKYKALMSQEDSEALTPRALAIQCNRWDLVFAMIGCDGLDQEQETLETLALSTTCPKEELSAILLGFSQFKQEYPEYYKAIIEAPFEPEFIGKTWKF